MSSAIWLPYGTMKMNMRVGSKYFYEPYVWWNGNYCRGFTSVEMVRDVLYLWPWHVHGSDQVASHTKYYERHEVLFILLSLFRSLSVSEHLLSLFSQYQTFNHIASSSTDATIMISPPFVYLSMKITKQRMNGFWLNIQNRSGIIQCGISEIVGRSEKGKLL